METTSLGLPVPPANGKQTRIICAIIALLVLIAFGAFTHAYWTGAQGGVDQNAYLVAGKTLANENTPALTPDRDAPQAFIGAMWVLGKNIHAEPGATGPNYYAKYPLGYPGIVAVVIRMSRSDQGWRYAYYIGPICMIVALAVLYAMAQSLLGSIWALAVLIWMASSAVTLGLTNSTDCHALDLCCAVSGFFLLLRWWREGGWRSAILAGVGLGYATLCRYSEALCVLPMMAVLVFRCRAMPAGKERSRTIAQAAGMLAAWLVPIGLLLGYNHATLGVWTGYAHTHETTAFAFAYFRDNWPTVLHQLNDLGLYWLFPLAVLGLFGWTAERRAWGIFLILWIVPSLLLYACYYWAPDTDDVSYLRFFLTLFPPLLLSAAYLLSRIAPLSTVSGRIAAIVVTLIVAAMGVNSAVPLLRHQLNENTALARLGDEAGTTGNRGVIPDGAVIFAKPWPLNYLQFATNDILFNLNLFYSASATKFIEEDATVPQGFDPRRAKLLADALRGHTDGQLIANLRQIIEDESGTKPVFFICSPKDVTSYQTQLNRGLRRGQKRLTLTIVAQWENHPLSKPATSTAAHPEYRRQAPAPASSIGEDYRCIAQVR